MTSSDFVDIARNVELLLVGTGFRTIDERVDPPSDNGVVEMRRGDIVLRLVRDRKQWFLETRSAAADEWFDSRYVLAAVGDTQPVGAPHK